MRAFYADPQGIDPSDLTETSVLVLEMASGRAYASPMANRRGKRSDTQDICYRINSVERSLEDAVDIVTGEGWCIHRDDEPHTQETEQ